MQNFESQNLGPISIQSVIAGFSARPVNDSDIDLVLEWRNSDRVRMNMFEYHIIPRENHVKWFASLKNNPTSRCWMFLYNGERIGVITIKLVDKASDTWIWGCYLGPMRAAPNAGTIMGFVAHEIFFEHMKVARVIGEAVAANKRSLEFNARLGYRTERLFTRTNSQGEDIPAVYLVMDQNEWPSHKKRLLGFLV